MTILRHCSLIWMLSIHGLNLESVVYLVTVFRNICEKICFFIHNFPNPGMILKCFFYQTIKQRVSFKIVYHMIYIVPETLKFCCRPLSTCDIYPKVLVKVK